METNQAYFAWKACHLSFGQCEIFDIFPPSKTECPVLTWHKNKERVFDHKQLPVLIPRGQSRANKLVKHV